MEEGRHVDIRLAMMLGRIYPQEKIMKKPSTQTTARTVILGVRMAPTMMSEIKTEAANRGIKVAALIEEVWHSYKLQHNKKLANNGR